MDDVHRSVRLDNHIWIGDLGAHRAIAGVKGVHERPGRDVVRFVRFVIQDRGRVPATKHVKETVIRDSD